MRGLTLWQPMAWAIAENHKPVENRSWPLPTNMVGEIFAVHAGKKYDPEWATMIRLEMGIDVPTASKISRGAIVAVATLRGCLDDEQVRILTAKMVEELHMPPSALESIPEWYSGPHGFLISDVRRLREPVPCRGLQGFWSLPTEIEQSVLAQLSPSRPVLVPDVTPSDVRSESQADSTRGPRQMTLIDPVLLERERCAGIVRDLAESHRAHKTGANDMVATALDRAALEIDG